MGMGAFLWNFHLALLYDRWVSANSPQGPGPWLPHAKGNTEVKESVMTENKDVNLVSIYALKIETPEMLLFGEQTCYNPPTDLCMEVLRNSMLEKDVMTNRD